MKDELAATGCGGNTLSHTPKSNPQYIQFSHHINQIFERSAKAIKFPHHQHIAGAHKGQRLNQARSIGIGTAHGIGEGLLTSSAFQRVLLQIKVLVKC
jgi:hypothetical protein